MAFFDCAEFESRILMAGLRRDRREEIGQTEDEEYDTGHRWLEREDKFMLFLKMWKDRV